MPNPQTAVEQNPSLWAATATPPELPALTTDAECDVCIVGAGIAGMSCAYDLARRGRRVIVLDDGPVGGGQTHRTTAHLSQVLDDRFHRLRTLRGEQACRQAVVSHGAAISHIERVAAEESIACDFERVDGYLFARKDGADEKELRAELEAARAAGLTDAQYLERCPPISGQHWGACLRFPGQAQFHPLKYLHGLSRALIARKGRIFTGTHVTEVQAGTPARVATLSGPVVSAGAVIVATNNPINDRVVIHTKQAPYTTYVVAGVIPKNALPKGLYWDMLDPYHYVRLHAGLAEDFLLVGGEDHKSGQVDDQAERFGRLSQWALEQFPQIMEFRHRWSGQVMETLDGLAYIGRNPLDGPNVYVVTGDSGMGMTHGAIAGMLLSDMITGLENPWAKLYDPARKLATAARDYAHENLNVARQYLDWLTPAEKDTGAIKPGTGGMIRQGLRKYAVYRDDDAQLHWFSAACPHLGCAVHWNGAEKTWDCPCHGSRFNCTGEVITGPANKGLEALHRTNEAA